MTDFYCAIEVTMVARNRPAQRCQAQCQSCEHWTREAARYLRDDVPPVDVLSPNAPRSAMSETEHE